MRPFIFPLFVLLLLLVSICSAQHQPQLQDVLYLKNGSILRGTIVEVVPDKAVKIKMADGSMFVYSWEEIERIAKEANPLYTPPDSGTTVQTGTDLVVFTAMSLPMGVFGSSVGRNAGLAETGFAFGVDGSIKLGLTIASMTSVTFSMNSMDQSVFSDIPGYSADVGSYKLIWILSGLKVFGSLSPGNDYNLHIQLGIIHGLSPEISITSSGSTVTQKQASATSFGYGLGGNLLFGRFVFGLRYLSGEPEYHVSASDGTNEPVENIIKQSTSCLLFTAGLML